MVTKMIGGKKWYSYQTRHYDREEAVKIQNICKGKGVKARLLKVDYGSGDIFWLVFIDSLQDWLCKVDKEG